MRKWIFLTVVLALAAGGAVWGIVAVGAAARARLRDSERYGFDFGQIECAGPPGQPVADFLSEVQYLSGLPGRLRLLDDNLPQQLATAFARHPWVEKVSQVEISPQRRVRAALIYRFPVLAVTWIDKDGPANRRGQFGELLRTRAVDGNGILLPANAVVGGLPTFHAGRQGPLNPAGKTWGDATVVAAARTAAYLHKEQKRLGLESLDAAPLGLVLYTSNKARILWGHAPGSEARGEATAAQKLAHLREYCAKNGDLGKPDGPYEHDVRSSEPLRRSLASVSP
jgi:hypothetical protein